VNSPHLDTLALGICSHPKTLYPLAAIQAKHPK